jgi:hypothetical protein
LPYNSQCLADSGLGTNRRFLRAFYSEASRRSQFWQMGLPSWLSSSRQDRCVPRRCRPSPAPGLSRSRRSVAPGTFREGGNENRRAPNSLDRAPSARPGLMRYDRKSGVVFRLRMNSRLKRQPSG